MASLHKWLVALLIMAVVAYYLPWWSGRAAALSANAYDLAEWVSLPPVVRQASIPLLATFLLRAVLAGLALLFGLTGIRQRGYLRAFSIVIALILAITLAPPLDFFRELFHGGWDDINHRQQFLLTVITLVGLAAIFLSRQQITRQPFALAIPLILAVAVILCALIGDLTALDVIRSLRVAAPVGIGVVILVGSISLYMVALVRETRQ